MAISVEILDGINQAVGEFNSRNDPDSDEKRRLLLPLLENANEAITQCLNDYKQSGEIPPTALANFLAQCEKIATLLGSALDRTTRSTIRSVLSQARLFDKDLEKSLDQYNQKLLKVLVLGSPIKSFFISSFAIKKVANASKQLSNTTERLATG